MPEETNDKDPSEVTELHTRNGFSGRTILVTGASRGIAAAIALALGEAGGEVLLHHSAEVDARAGFPDSAAELAARINKSAGSAHLIDADLTRPGAGSELAHAVLAGCGAIDSVVLSASIQIHKPFLLQSSEEIERQIRLNILANIEILQLLVPGMVQRGFGRVLTIGSIQETAPSAEMPIYSLTKAALRNLVENLAVQAGGAGITINNLAPGLIATDRNAFRRNNPDEWQRISSRANPVGRAGTPEDMVAPALYFLSADTSFVTGATLYATGGAHVRQNSADGAVPRLVIPGTGDVAAQ